MSSSESQYNQDNLKANHSKIEEIRNIEVKEKVKINREEARIEEVKENQITLEDLLKKPKLTRNDFITLKKLIEVPEEIEYVLASRNIVYAPKGPEFDEALKLYFGSALGSINHEHPVVCDEYSILNAALLLGMNNIKEIYLGRLSDLRREEEGGDKYDHAFVIYQTEDNNWNYISNNSISEICITTKEDIVKFIANQTGYDSKQMVYKLRKIDSLGEWVYDNKESRKMDPYYEKNRDNKDNKENNYDEKGDDEEDK